MDYLRQRRRLNLILCKYAFLIVLLGLSTRLQSQCLSLVKGAIAFDVSACRDVDSAKDLKDVKKESFYRGLTAKDRGKFLRQYRGQLVKGKVVASRAIDLGLSKEKGALNGQTISIYLRPGQTQCKEVQGKRIAGVMDEVCCAGGADGHTPGQMHTVFDSGNQVVFFAGDLIPGTAWVHLPITMGYDRFPERLIEEKKELYKLAVPNHWMIFYTHDPKAAVSFIIKNEKSKFEATGTEEQLKNLVV